MRYKLYGNTGKSVSVLGFGGMRFLDGDSVEDAAAIVRRAGELGVNYFDTAPGYCGDRSESIMGEAFKNMLYPFYVSTKSNVNSERNADEVRRKVDQSLKKLNVGKINFYHMWCILNMDQYRAVVKKGGPYDGALRAKDEGLIDHIVFSTHCDGEDIETMVNDGLFEGVTLGYNIINFKFRRQGLAAAYKRNMGVAAMNPLGGGTIPRNADYFSFMGENGEDAVQAALRFNLSHKEVTTVLTGISSIEDLERNVKYVERCEPLSPEKIAEIEGRIGSEMDRLCTGCGYCKGCPAGIEIPKYMDAYNAYILNKEKKASLDTLMWHWCIPVEKAKECVECGQCEEKCTQHIDIIRRLAFLHSDNT
ncbi:MAG: aldo/keto reductase [Firmicutes bacterium]|nr:aldo/keto reductase [Bacillota bacterium]